MPDVGINDDCNTGCQCKRQEDEPREEQAATSAQLDATYAQIDQLYSAKQQLQDEINSLDANLVNVMVSIQTLKVISVIKKQTFSRHRLTRQKAQNAKMSEAAMKQGNLWYLHSVKKSVPLRLMSADNL